ncbi:hypothetical protein MSG28_014870 [Choristoneura fumiferana]|uniref:Uncharacterized protein n=1 Tax=Choristoneura fumiferana TaxID=7141 RepID=A0ACC0JT46_CHOFU|nr:hypothetical protein MSG28_014870 [Choristoneura fumiferana]
MESAACRRRASDAEQSARWTYSATAECEPVAVKEEPEGSECGVSEAAVAEGLYFGHVVKDEVVIGPETVQQQDVAFSMQNAFCRLEGPCSLKPEGGADDTPDCTHTCLGEGPRCNRSPEQQYRLTSCFVRLERLPVGELHRGKPCSSMQAIPSASALRRSREQGQRRSCNLPTPLACHKQDTLNTTEVDPCQLQPAGGAGAAPECTHTRPGEGPRCNMCHDQQFQLRSCSVRLERVLMEDLPTCDTCLVIFYCKSSLKNHNCTHSVEESNICAELATHHLETERIIWHGIYEYTQARLLIDELTHERRLLLERGGGLRGHACHQEPRLHLTVVLCRDASERPRSFLQEAILSLREAADSMTTTRTNQAALCWFSQNIF